MVAKRAKSLVYIYGWTHGPKFCVGPHTTPRKVYECSKLQKFVSKSLWFLLNFENAEKYHEIWKRFLVQYCTKEMVLTNRATIKSWNRRWAQSTLAPNDIIFENKVIWELNVLIYISIGDAIKQIKNLITVYGCQKLCKTCWHTIQNQHQDSYPHQI